MAVHHNKDIPRFLAMQEAFFLGSVGLDLSLAGFDLCFVTFFRSLFVCVFFFNMVVVVASPVYFIMLVDFMLLFVVYFFCFFFFFRVWLVGVCFNNLLLFSFFFFSPLVL